MDELRAVACNYTHSTRIVAKGAKAYVLRENPGNGNDRIVVLVRSRGGRWVEKYEDSRILGTYRVVTVPSVKVYYPRLRRAAYPWLGQAFCDRMNARQFVDAERPLGADSRARA